MNARGHIGKTLVLLVLMAWTLPAPSSVWGGGRDIQKHDWISAIRSAVLAAQVEEGDHNGSKYAPYLGQLYIVQSAAQRGDDAATYASMNRFMDMLVNREHGIAPGSADWLFDFCYVVTPAKYHDVPRHIQKFKEHQFWEPVG